MLRVRVDFFALLLESVINVQTMIGSFISGFQRVSCSTHIDGFFYSFVRKVYQKMIDLSNYGLAREQVVQWYMSFFNDDFLFPQFEGQCAYLS